MQKKFLVLGIAAMMTAGVANAELQAFKVNGQTVSVAQQKELYDAAVAQGQPAGPELERQIKSMLTQQTVLLQAAKNAKIEKDPLVKKNLEHARDQVLVNAYARHWVQKTPVKDADVKAAYDAEKANYGDTEYEVRHILVKTEDQAKNILKRLEKGTDFDKLAKEFSEDQSSKDQGGKLGWVVPRQFVASFGTSFALCRRCRERQGHRHFQRGRPDVPRQAQAHGHPYPDFFGIIYPGFSQNP